MAPLIIMKNTKQTFKECALLFLVATFSVVGFAQTAEEVSAFSNLETSFVGLTSERIEHVKSGSRPFIFSQHKKTKTVVMIHGLSDSPGSMKEVSKVYYSQGYNVMTVLLRDHGLAEDYRDAQRKTVTIAKWREDIDQVMRIAYQMSDSNKVALVGYSLGGALATDAAHRYEGKISSLVLMAPLLKMNQGWAAAIAAPLLKKTNLVMKKGVPETEHFYPNFMFNQIDQAYKLTKIINNEVAEHASETYKAVPKMMFLTDADTTIVNDGAYKTAEMLNVPSANIIMYNNPKGGPIVLHRDLPMRTINATKAPNPHIDDLLLKLEAFLQSLN
ncbi:MAG: alpha/beta fold hydrolase [Bdellovibrionales bacterium]|nr:alpha/beta fold hydrolase [Bdellovibrionales bacterium]